MAPRAGLAIALMARRQAADKAAADKAAADKAAAAQAQAAPAAAAPEEKKAAPVAPAPEATETAAQAAAAKKEETKNKLKTLKNALIDSLDSCLLNKDISDCKGFNFIKKDSDKLQENRITRITNELKDALLTVVQRGNESNNNTHKKNIISEILFKFLTKLIYSFIKKLLDKVNIKDIINIDKNIETDQKYTRGISLVENYINSYYSNGIAIIEDALEVKYYKFDKGNYQQKSNNNVGKKLGGYLIVRIHEKNILIHQLVQQIIIALIDSITKDNKIFDKYYKLKKSQ
jgi:uncharacterized protein (UPF0305 family)